MDELKEVRRHTPGGVGGHAAVSRGERGDADQDAPRVRRSCLGASGRAQLWQGAGIRATQRKPRRSGALDERAISDEECCSTRFCSPRRRLATRHMGSHRYRIARMLQSSVASATSVCVFPYRRAVGAALMEPAKSRAVGRAHVPIRCGLGPPEFLIVAVRAHPIFGQAGPRR
jgi:hypothetical protein